LALIAVVLTAACADRSLELQTAPAALQPGDALLAITSAGGAVGCAPHAAIARRAVVPRSAHDRNGNGYVCEERLGPPGAERVLTTDDVAMPRRSGH